MRLRLPAFGFFILSLLLLWYVKPFSCNSLIDTWFGMLPGQLAATAAVLLISFVGTPKSCGGHMPILQAGPAAPGSRPQNLPVQWKPLQTFPLPVDTQSARADPMTPGGESCQRWTTDTGQLAVCAAGVAAGVCVDGGGEGAQGGTAQCVPAPLPGGGDPEGAHVLRRNHDDLPLLEPAHL